MGTDKKLAAAIALLKKHGYAKVKKKRPPSDLYFRLSYLFGFYSVRIKKPITKRKITMAIVNSRALDKVLDEFFTGKKRKAFDDATDKGWTDKHCIKDIASRGKYKKYKLVERHINKYWNSETTKIIFDPEYTVQDFINKHRKK